uniref:Wsv161-like protein n=1 Tax=Metapenaeus joyneri majanivirus TaxID=2984280 RepID=A0A9C7BWF8_9VIRU|nr:MAG: wsv161-like protein [Metapenaeus joyneri majanivirus]
MTKNTPPLIIIKARKENKLEQIKHDADLKLMGMVPEKKGPPLIKKKIYIKKKGNSTKKNNSNNNRNNNNNNSNNNNSNIINNNNDNNNNNNNKNNTRKTKIKSLKQISLQPKYSSANTNNKDENNNKNKLDSILPLPPLQIPRLTKLYIGKKLRRILLEEIYLPIRERTLEKKCGRIERWTKRNKIYNRAFNIIIKYTNTNAIALNNNFTINDINNTKIDENIKLINNKLRQIQINYIKNTLIERSNYEEFCTVLFNLFKLPYLLNKNFHDNLVLIDVNNLYIKELSFKEYKEKLFFPIWKNMSLSISNIIGASDDEFNKCLDIIEGRIQTFANTTNELKKEVAGIQKFQNLEQNNKYKIEQHEQKNKLNKEMEKIFAMQAQLLSQQQKHLSQLQQKQLLDDQQRQILNQQQKITLHQQQEYI